MSTDFSCQRHRILTEPTFPKLTTTLSQSPKLLTITGEGTQFQNMAPRKRLRNCRKSEETSTYKLEGNSDGISQLPEAILQHILFFLPVQDAARVSTLSKTWLRAWNSLPHFAFSFCQLGMPEFVTQVNQSLSPLLDQKAIIESFTLNIPLPQEVFASYTDDWILLVMRNCVRELCINISNPSYILPHATFASKSLVKLRLEGCRFPSNLFRGAQVFNCLKELYLVRVVAHEDQVQNLINCFPSLEKLTLKLHTTITRLVLNNFPMLKYVAVAVEILRVDAPSLRTLILCGPHRLHASNSTVNIKVLWCILSRLIFNDNNLLQELVSKLPLLETLFLNLSNNGRFRIQHCNLKTLHLYWKFENPTEVEIDAPKLSRFYCNGSVFPSLRIMSTSIKERETLELHIRGVTFGILDGSHIHQLGNCLQNFNPSIEVNLHNLCTENFLTLAQLQEQGVISRPSNVRKLVLSSVSASSDYTSFLDGLLWTCHPSTLLIKECSANGDNFIKFLCRELLGRQGNPTCCMDDRLCKCWRHFLKGVEVQYYTSLCEPKKPILLRSSNLSHTLIMLDTGKEVEFRFDWLEDPVCNNFQNF